MGTPSWVSPEICKGTTYSKEVDVWAFGCFAWELAAGHPPFHHYSKDLSALFNAIVNEKVPRIPENWSDEFADFINKCLIKDPRERWTFDQLLSH